MGLRDRRWHPYTGGVTGPLARFFVIPRYGLRSLFAGRIFLAFCLAAWIVPLVFAAQIYLRRNVEALAILGLTVQQLDLILPIDATFFRRLLAWQAPFAFLATVRAAPAVVVPDLRGGGLPLLLSRPLTPFGWITGKVTAVAIVLSAITWIPASLCLALQASLDPRWLLEHTRLVAGTLLGGFLTALWLALIGVAVASAVRSKPGAAATLFGGVLLLAAVGAIIEAQAGLTIGSALQLPRAADGVWRALLGMGPGDAPSALAALVVLGTLALLAGLVLRARIRPIEIVR